MNIDFCGVTWVSRSFFYDSKQNLKGLGEVLESKRVKLYGAY